MSIVREMSVLKNTREEVSSEMEETRYIKKDLRDLTFRVLFSTKSNVLEAYKVLHPEDKEVKLEDVEISTIDDPQRKLAGNDLSFTVRGKKIILIEAQTTENENTPLRILGYLLDMYQLILKKGASEKAVYRKKAVMLPDPEAYVIFSNTEEKRDVMSLAQIHFQNDEVLEFKVKVLTKERTSGILLEYIRFCEIFKTLVDLHGSTRETWGKIIQTCKDEGILTEFLAQQGELLMENYHFIMTSEEIWEEEIRDAKAMAEAAKARAEAATARAEDATARAEDATARAEDAIARAEDATARAEDATARAEDATAKVEASEARVAVRDQQLKNAVAAFVSSGMQAEEICQLLQMSEEDLKRYL